MPLVGTGKVTSGLNDIFCGYPRRALGNFSNRRTIAINHRATVSSDDREDRLFKLSLRAGEAPVGREQ